MFVKLSTPKTSTLSIFSELKLLYWWISASPKMAQRPTGQILEFDDILHYQKIIVALSKTDRLMKEIDEIKIE